MGFCSLAKHLHGYVLRLKAKGFVESPGAGIPFPDVEGDIVAALLLGEGFSVFEKDFPDVLPAGLLVDAEVIDIQ